MSYNSKYTGKEVEELLDQVANGNTGGEGSGGITTETDPIFSASPAAVITDENISSWNDKVDKVEGKQLSTEDFTTLLKQKLDGLSNYDDTAIQASVSKLRTDFDTLVSGDTTTAIKTFNEVIAFLDGLEDTEDLASIIASIEQQIAAKYTKPSTGIPKTDLASDVQTSLGRADTALQSYTEQYKGTVTGVKMNGTTKNPSSGVVDLGTVITAHQDISGKQDKLVSGTNIKTINGTSILGSGNITIEGGIGEGGDYLPLTGGTISGDLTVEEGEDGFGNINASGDITAGAGFRGRWFPAGGKYELGGSSNGFNIINTSGDEKVGELIFNGDGTKFLANDGSYKTIETSGGTSSGGSGAYAEVNHGTSDTTFALTPNTFHVWDEVASLDLSFGTETSGVANEFLFQFTSGATATTLTLPSDIAWVGGMPTIEPYKQYQCSVVNKLGLIIGESPNVTLIIKDARGNTHETLVVPWGTTGQDLVDRYGFYANTGENICYVYDGAGRQLQPNISTRTVVSSGTYVFDTNGMGEPI